MGGMKLIDWRLRAAADLIVLAAFLFVLSSQDAPGWAMTLAVFIAIHPSRIAIAGDLAALQTTVKTTIKDEGHAQLERQKTLMQKFLDAWKSA